MGMGMMSDPQRDSCVAVALLLACFPGVCFGQYCRDVTLNLTSITAPASTTFCLSDCNWDTYLIIKGIDTDSYHDIPEVGGTVPSNVAYNLGCEVPGNTVTARVMDYNTVGFDEQYASGMLRLDPGPLQQSASFVGGAYTFGITYTLAWTGGCTSHSQCSSSQYCDTNYVCYACSFTCRNNTACTCWSVDDAVDDTCPSNCGAAPSVPPTRRPTGRPTTANPATAAPTTAAPSVPPTRRPTGRPTTATPTTAAPTTAAPSVPPTRRPTDRPTTAVPHECTAHSQCGRSSYCTSANVCAQCGFCTGRNDAMDNVCPPVCTAMPTAAVPTTGTGATVAPTASNVPTAPTVPDSATTLAPVTAAPTMSTTAPSAPTAWSGSATAGPTALPTVPSAECTGHADCDPTTGGYCNADTECYACFFTCADGTACSCATQKDAIDGACPDNCGPSLTTPSPSTASDSGRSSSSDDLSENGVGAFVIIGCVLVAVFLVVGIALFVRRGSASTKATATPVPDRDGTTVTNPTYLDHRPANDAITIRRDRAGPVLVLAGSTQGDGYLHVGASDTDTDANAGTEVMYDGGSTGYSTANDSINVPYARARAHLGVPTAPSSRALYAQPNTTTRPSSRAMYEQVHESTLDVNTPNDGAYKSLDPDDMSWRTSRMLVDRAETAGPTDQPTYDRLHVNGRASLMAGVADGEPLGAAYTSVGDLEVTQNTMYVSADADAAPAQQPRPPQLQRGVRGREKNGSLYDGFASAPTDTVAAPKKKGVRGRQKNGSIYDGFGQE